MNRAARTTSTLAISALALAALAACSGSSSGSASSSAASSGAVAKANCASLKTALSSPAAQALAAAEDAGDTAAAVAALKDAAPEIDKLSSSLPAGTPTEVQVAIRGYAAAIDMVAKGSAPTAADLTALKENDATMKAAIAKDCG